jgi:pimeloyl-ACP methyl ester carboxylesterase
LAEGNRVCAYERAHYGNSAPLPEGQIQSLRDYAIELETFLALDAMRGPFVLVGYSYGAWVARYHAAHHPDTVAGMVLIDGPHVDWIRRMRAEMSPEDWSKMQDILDWFLANRGHDPVSSQYEMAQAPPLPDGLPIVVINRGLDHQGIRPAELSESGFRLYNDIHFRLAAEHFELTSATRGIVAENSQHLIPEDEPEVVLEAVQSLLDRISASP